MEGWLESVFQDPCLIPLCLTWAGRTIASFPPSRQLLYPSSQYIRVRRIIYSCDGVLGLRRDAGSYLPSFKCTFL